MRKIWAVSLAIIFVLTSSGCAAVTAASEPSRKDMSVLNPGTPRSLVIAELGSPIHSEKDGLSTKDIYAFQPGAAVPAKIGRVLFHLAGDFFTLFLWEAIGWPAEKACTSQQKKAEVTYDAGNKVISSRVLK